MSDTTPTNGATPPTITDRPPAGISLEEGIARARAQGGVTSTGTRASTVPAEGGPPPMGHNQPPSPMQVERPNVPPAPSGAPRMGDPGITHPDPMLFARQPGAPPAPQAQPQAPAPAVAPGPPPGTTAEEVHAGWLRRDDYTRKMQEIAQLRTQLAAQIAEAQRIHGSFVHARDRLLEVLPPGLDDEAKEFAKVDWVTLSAQNPALYAQLDARFKLHQRQRQAVIDAATIRERERQAVIASEIEQGNLYLNSKYPDIWPDLAKRQQFQARLKAHLLRTGFTPAQLEEGTRNPLLIVLAEDSRRLAELTAHPLQQAPPQPSLRPSTVRHAAPASRGRGDRAPTQTEVEAAQRRLDAGRGKLEDGLAVLKARRMALLSGTGSA